jgi:hypothetical protein
MLALDPARASLSRQTCRAHSFDARYQAAVLSQLGLIDRNLPFADVTEVGEFLRGKARGVS